jgi:hypothetical protein
LPPNPEILEKGSFTNLCGRGTFGKGMVSRGGSRHRSKPYIESGLLIKVLLKHEDILVNFKGYESCSRNSGADPKGLIYCLDLVNDLLDLEASAEIHPARLRQGLLHILTQKPSLKNTCQSGSLWVHMRSERLNVLLFHIRRLAQKWANTSLCECPFWPGAREAPKHFEKGGYSGACGTIKMRSKRRKRRRKRRKKGQK